MNAIEKKKKNILNMKKYKCVPEITVENIYFVKKCHQHRDNVKFFFCLVKN
jgi:hypothetical protein